MCKEIAYAVKPVYNDTIGNKIERVVIDKLPLYAVPNSLSDLKKHKINNS